VRKIGNRWSLKHFRYSIFFFFFFFFFFFSLQKNLFFFVYHDGIRFHWMQNAQLLVSKLNCGSAILVTSSVDEM